MILSIRLSGHISVLVKHFKFSRHTKIAYGLIVCYMTLTYIHRGKDYFQEHSYILQSNLCEYILKR